MSDGLYEIENTLGLERISGTVKVRKGVFQGENDDFTYSGNFHIKDGELQGVLAVENKTTKRVEKIPLSARIQDDENFPVSLKIENKEISLMLRKEKHRPLMK